MSDKSFNEFQIGSETGTQIIFHPVLYHPPCGKHQLALLPLHPGKVGSLPKPIHLMDLYLYMFPDKSVISRIHH
jgi:hypothetical protein